MKIAVLFGGNSSERNVSVASGAQVMSALVKAGHQVVAIDTARGALTEAELTQLIGTGVDPVPPSSKDLAVIHPDTLAIAKSADIKSVDAVFLALHGGTGENGTLQGLLELAGITYTGSGVQGSAMAMDKDISKHLFQAAGIPTPAWLMAPVDADLAAERIGYPLIVKPCKEGSTIGLSIVRNAEGLAAAIALASQYDSEVLVEQFIAGRELTVGILGDRALAVGEIIPKAEIFDYESKYQSGGATEIFPADLTSEQTLRVQELGLRAHRVLKLRDYSRVDFRMDAEGNFWVLEVNTLPGMTATSLLPQSAQAVGISFPKLCDEICRLAMLRKG